jgi:MarR family transcriptional regulator, negative regulator of the multidrug operon emrRAB
MRSEPAGTPGPLEQRAVEIEAAVRRSAARLTAMPVNESIILRLLILLGRELSGLLEEILGPHGLNQTDYRTLMMLFSQPAGVAHPSDLCAYVAQSPANMTRIADSLEQRGLIRRVACDADRRRTILRITSRGEALVRALLPETAGRTKAIFRNLPQSARRALLTQLRSIITQIDRHAHKPRARRRAGSEARSA